MERRRNFGLGSVVSIILGLLFALSFVVGGLFFRSLTQPLEGGVVVEGTVVVSSERQRSGQSVEVLAVEFVDPATGSTHEVIDYLTAAEGGGVGDTRDVSLMPGQPRTARILGGSILWLSLVGVGVAAAVAVVIAIWWSSKPTKLTKPPTGPAMALPEGSRIV